VSYYHGPLHHTYTCIQYSTSAPNTSLTLDLSYLLNLEISPLHLVLFLVHSFLVHSDGFSYGSRWKSRGQERRTSASVLQVREYYCSLFIPC
jgi:hypothetical protein